MSSFLILFIFTREELFEQILFISTRMMEAKNQRKQQRIWNAISKEVPSCKTIQNETNEISQYDLSANHKIEPAGIGRVAQIPRAHPVMKTSRYL